MAASAVGENVLSGGSTPSPEQTGARPHGDEVTGLMGSSMVALPLLLPGVEGVATCGSRLSEGVFLLGPELLDVWDDGDAAGCRTPDSHAMGKCDLTQEVQYSFGRSQDMVNRIGAPPFEQAQLKQDDSIYPRCGIERGLELQAACSLPARTVLELQRDSACSLPARTDVSVILSHTPFALTSATSLNLHSTALALAVLPAADDFCCTIALCDVAEDDFDLARQRFLLNYCTSEPIGLVTLRARSSLTCGRRTA
jgi:hypothetical protein